MSESLTGEQLTAIKDAFAACTENALASEGPVLLGEIRRLKAELERAREDIAFLERATLPELRRTVQHHKDGKQRWRERAEKAEARIAELRLCADCGHGEEAHSKDGETDCNASGARVRKCTCSFFIPGGAS